MAGLCSLILYKPFNDFCARSVLSRIILNKNPTQPSGSLPSIYPTYYYHPKNICPAPIHISSVYTADQIKRNIRELYPETTITNLGGTRTNQSTPTGFSEDYILVVLQYTGTGRPTISFFVLVQTVHLIHVIRLFSELYSVTSGWIAFPAYGCSWKVDHKYVPNVILSIDFVWFLMVT